VGQRALPWDFSKGASFDPQPTYLAENRIHTSTHCPSMVPPAAREKGSGRIAFCRIQLGFLRSETLK